MAFEYARGYEKKNHSLFLALCCVLRGCAFNHFFSLTDECHDLTTAAALV